MRIDRLRLDIREDCYGVRRCGPNKTAEWGAMIGIIFGPFIGAVIGQIASGTAIKLAVAFMMLGTFALALVI